MQPEEDNDWMDEEYPRLEECDGCQRWVYSTSNLECMKCMKINECLHDAFYHCADCAGQDKKYINANGDLDHGFDLCKKCYDENPIF